MSTTTQPPKPKRRWYQFSLRTLLVVMTLFTVTAGCFVGWVQYMRQRAQENRQRVAAVEEAVAAIEELGGEWSEFPTARAKYEKLRPQTWLERQFDDPGDADDPVGVLEVSEVVLIFTIIDDTTLEHLTRLTNLKFLSLAATNISDAELEHLKGLTNLETLYLDHTYVTDAGLEHLKGLTNLEELSLTNTNVTDEGVKKLQQALPNCRIVR